MAPSLPNYIFYAMDGPDAEAHALDGCLIIDTNIDKVLEDGASPNTISEATTAFPDCSTEGPCRAINNNKGVDAIPGQEDLERPVPFLTLFAWALVGASGWWSSNSIFSQLPLFVGELPSAECLGNQLSMATQIGNLLPLAYILLRSHYRLYVPTVIQAMMCLAICVLVASSFFWDALIDGNSLPLLALQCLAGGVGCLSNSTYWVLMMSHPAVCSKAMGSGMSFGGVLSTSLAALQLGGRPAGLPRFGVRTFFLIAAAVQGAFWFVARQMDRRFRQRGPVVFDAGFLPAKERLLDKPKGDGSISCPLGAGLLKFMSFWAHAIAYAAPSLFPFVAAGYTIGEQEQQMLVWMLATQQWGEWLGRVVVPKAARNGILAGCLAALSAIFLFVLFCALNVAQLERVLPFYVAEVLLPGAIFVFYMSYGMLQTGIFLRARDLHEDVAVVEKVASDMGFMGQTGAFSSTLIATFVLSFSADASASCKR